MDSDTLSATAEMVMEEANIDTNPVERVENSEISAGMKMLRRREGIVLIYAFRMYTSSNAIMYRKEEM
jgi:hypothetical protein